MNIQTTNPPAPVTRPELIPPLRDGDRLTRAEFQETRYNAMLHIKKAELLEGVVYMPPSPISDDHGSPHFGLIGWLAALSLCNSGRRRFGQWYGPLVTRQ